MESTGDMKEKSKPSPAIAQCSSLSLPFPRNYFDPRVTIVEEDDDQPHRPGCFAAAAVSSGNGSNTSGSRKGCGLNNICDKSRSTENIVNDICDRVCYDSSSGHHTISSHKAGGRGEHAIGRASTPASGTGYSNSGFQSLGGGTTSSTSYNNRAGTSASCDSLSSLELEMTYDPQGCIYGLEGCLTPDAAWKQHLEFLAYVPES